MPFPEDSSVPVASDGWNSRIWPQQSLFILIGIAVFILPAILLYPFNGDNDIYQSMALALYRNHGLPFLSSWDHNFPGIVVLHTLSIAWFGGSMFGFRLLEYIWQVTTVFLLYRVSRMWVSTESSLLACLLFAFYYVQGHSAVMGQRDGFAILPLLAASGALVSAYRSSQIRKGLLITSGVCYGIAVVLRPTFALLLLVALCTLFGYDSTRKRAWAYTIFGFILMVLVFTLPYLLRPQGMAEAWNSAVRFNLDVYTPMASLASRSAWLNRYPSLCYALFIGWMISLAVYYHKHWKLLTFPLPSPEKWFLFASYSALLMGIFVMRSLLTYQFTPFYALFLPVPAMLALDWKARFGRRASFGFWTILLVAGIGLYPWRMVIPFVRQGMSLNAAYSEEDPGYQQNEEVSFYLQHMSSPNDRVEIASMTSDPLWVTKRSRATRFTTMQALLFLDPSGKFTEYQKQWRKEYIETLDNNPPKLLVLANEPPLRNGLEGISGFSELLQHSYFVDTIIHGWIVYQRKE